MKEFDRLKEIMARLRSKDGCPWDREQTHMSLKPACMEEAAEVVCGINILEATGNADNLKEELGDLLLQVVLHAQIAEEEGLFTLEDVCRGISAVSYTHLDVYKRQVFIWERAGIEMGIPAREITMYPLPFIFTVLSMQNLHSRKTGREVKG